jgi:hypothetical protein
MKSGTIERMFEQNGVVQSGARIYRPSFRKNKSNTLVIYYGKRSFWACFRESWVYKFRHRARYDKGMSRSLYIIKPLKVTIFLYAEKGLLLRPWSTGPGLLCPCVLLSLYINSLEISPLVSYSPFVFRSSVAEPELFITVPVTTPVPALVPVPYLDHKKQFLQGKSR